jgi:alpha-beta hydrolase superfamily lysophospholipase
MLSNQDGHKTLALAELLIARGLGVVRFDFAGRGRSDGDLWSLTYSRQVEDLQAIVDTLVREGVGPLGVYGSSMGGAVALLCASREESICAIATLAAVGRTDLLVERHPDAATAWKKRGYISVPEGRIGPRLFEDARLHDVLAATRFIRAPVLVVHGTADEVVPFTDGDDIAAAARNAQLHYVDGADHRFSAPEHRSEALCRIADFLAAALHQ